MENKMKISVKFIEDICKLAKSSKKPSFLEVGFDNGEKFEHLHKTFTSLYGVDQNSSNYATANKCLQENNIKNVMLFCGDSTRIPFNSYNVILINSRSYDEALYDTINVFIKNINEKPFLVVYSFKYDTEGEVSKFCKEYFSSFAVSVGDTEESGVACAFSMESKKKYLNQLKLKIKDSQTKNNIQKVQKIS